MAERPKDPETLVRMSDPAGRQERAFSLAPAADELKALASELGLIGLRKLRFSGRLLPEGRRDWRLDATLGATVVQRCVVTLAPVTTRIETPVARHYAADYADPGETEAEMPEDENREPLPEVVDLAQVMAEALALALPLYPRAAGAELGEAIYTAPGTAPLTDAEARPFSGLRGLRDRLEDDGEDD